MLDIITTSKTVSEETTTSAVNVADKVQVVLETVVRTDSEGETTTSREFVRHMYPEGEDPFGYFVVADPSLVDALRHGFTFADECLHLKPFTHVCAGKPYAVVRLCGYDHTAYDSENDPITVGVHFDYLDGRVNDYSFDVEKLLEHLQGRDDVTVEEQVCHGPIHQVPHYNAGGCCGYRSFSFTWHPTNKVYREYHSKAANVDSFSERDIAHTIMGNDQFRVIRTEEES